MVCLNQTGIFSNFEKCQFHLLSVGIEGEEGGMDQQPAEKRLDPINIFSFDKPFTATVSGGK